MSVYRAFGLDGPKTQLLLPVSFGVSSSVLLHILNTDRQHRLDNGRPLGYDFKILVIEPSTVTATGIPFDQNYEALEKNFPMHTISRIPFHSIFDHVLEMEEITKEYAGSKFIDDSTRSNNGLRVVGVSFEAS